MTRSPSNQMDKIFTGTGVVLILFALCATWSVPRSVSDLYISLAAGHDVIDGKLGAPDDWSFSTSNRVWINQNWGADVILYLVETALGGTGLLAVKFILLILCALFLILAMHERKIPPAVNLTVTSVIIISVNAYATLRPNLFTFPLAALELWLLFKSEKHFSCLWTAVLVILFWANVHAGFIYGLGMLCLWAVCQMVPELWRKNRKVFKQGWQLPAAVAAAILLAGLANPFGLKNLSLPFTMMQGSEWNTTLDWLPIWDKDIWTNQISSLLIFLGLVFMTLLLLGLRLTRTLLRKKNRGSLRAARRGSQDQKQNDLRIVLFEALLAFVTITMTVLSNRFIILALVALTPLLAGQFAWLCRIFRYYRLIVATVFCFVLVYAVLVLYDNFRSYDPHNPVTNTGTGTLFEKMHYANRMYDRELINFINTNRISGHVYCPWKWEGYLRLNCPRLKLFIGGRAQQIYDIETYNQYMYTSGYDIPSYRGKAPTDVLNAIDAHYLIADNSSNSQSLVLTALNCGNWNIIYADAEWLLFANTRYQNSAAAISLLTDDKLIFENEAARAMSKAACLLSNVDRWQTQTLLPLFAEAWKYEPGWLWGYWILYSNLGFDANFMRELVRLMEEQLVRLEGMSLESADADTILRCRIYLLSALAEYARNQNLPAIAAERRRSLETDKRLETALYRKWKAITR